MSKMKRVRERVRMVPRKRVVRVRSIVVGLWVVWCGSLEECSSSWVDAVAVLEIESLDSLAGEGE